MAGNVEEVLIRLNMGEDVTRSTSPGIQHLCTTRWPVVGRRLPRSSSREAPTWMSLTTRTQPPSSWQSDMDKMILFPINAKKPRARAITADMQAFKAFQTIRQARAFKRLH